MNEELLYNSGRPRRTRSSMANTLTPTTSTSNPYKKPTYLVGRSNNATPEDSPDEGLNDTPISSVRGRRKPGRPFGSVTKNRSSPATSSTMSPARGGRRSTRGRGSLNSRNIETPVSTPTSSSRKRSSTVTLAPWSNKSRPECVANRNDRRSTGSNKARRKKKRRGGYNTQDYHYGSDFDSEEIDSEPEEVAPSESESAEDPIEEDMPLDEPMESDSDLSIGSTRLQGLLSIPLPIWMDPDAIFEELEIPRSSDDLLLTRELLVDAVAVYEPLRRFSNLVRLTPFRFEDFCAALANEEQSVLLAEIHIQLLKSLIREDEVNGTVFGPNECKDSIQSVLFFMDSMTWAECLRAYIESEPAWSEVLELLTSVEYPLCGPKVRIQILTFLIDMFVLINSVRDPMTSEGVLHHEDHCRNCNQLGELICCEMCPAVYHLECTSFPPGFDPPDDWLCPVCENHKLSGVSDCISEIEKATLLLRHEKLGYDRHGRKYWFMVRRILVQSDDDSQVWYYSTHLQVEELLHRLDSEKYEDALVKNILENKEEIFRQMGVTERVTNRVNTNHRKTYLEAENVFLSRIHEERELIKSQEMAEKHRIEEQTRLAIKKELEQKQRLEEAERIKKEEEKRKIREERLAKRNQIKLKQRLGKIVDDETLQQLLLNDESKDSIMDHDETSIKDGQGDTSEASKEGSSDSRLNLENGDVEEEFNIHEAETQKLVPDDFSYTDEKIDSTDEHEVNEKKIEVIEEAPTISIPEVKLEPKDIEPVVKTSILPKIAAKSKSLSLEVDSEERMTRLRSTGLYKLGQEGSYRNYVNSFTTDPLALSKSQHTEERDKRRVMSHKFSLTPASECKWTGMQQGQRAVVVATIRQTLLNMEVTIPTTLMHCNWVLLRKAWIAAVSGCGSANDFSKALTVFAACLRPSVFNPVWSEGVGHVKLLRTSTLQKEFRQKNEKADKKFRDDEEDRLKTLPQFVRYSIPIKHQVWKQKGEEFRVHGSWGWIWLSNLRKVKVKDARTVGLLAGPHKHVIQVKGTAGKVKTMLIDPDVYNKLMAKRSVSMENKKADLPPDPPTALPKQEPMDTDESVEKVVNAVLMSLLNDVVEGKEVPTLTSHVKVEAKVESTQIKQEVKSAVSAEKKPEVKTEKLESSASPSRKFRTELINVSLGIVSANRILYPKIAYQSSLDTLLDRRIKAQSTEEQELLDEYGAEIIESMKGPPPVFDNSKIVIPVDATFPLAGGYARQCYSYNCQLASKSGQVNFEAKCYSPMCRLKYVITESRRRKLEKDRIADFEKMLISRKEIEMKRTYNQKSTSEKVYLKKLPLQLKNGQELVKYPLTSKFCYNSSKRPSILILPKHELMKIGRQGGRVTTPSGFTPNLRPNTWLWPYPSGRPFFKTTWQYRTIHAIGLHAAALQLRLLYASIRWDDVQMKPLNADGKSVITTDMEVITSEILDHRIVGRFMEVFQYLRRRRIVPIDAPKTIRVVTPSRSGLRKRKRAESPDNAEPVVKEEWVDEFKFEVWEIRLYGDKLEKKNEKKPEPPASATRTKTGITLKVPEKFDPSPKEIKDKEKEIPPKVPVPVCAPSVVPEVIEEVKSQRIVHLSKRDNHAKIANNTPKVPTPTASQQLLQQQTAAAAAAAAASQGLPLGSSPVTKAVSITQAMSPSGRKFFVTKPTVTTGVKPSPLRVNETPKTGILKKPSVAPSLNVGSPVSNVASTALINAKSTAVIGQQQILTFTAPGSPTSGQSKFQVFRGDDGKLQVKGLMPGQAAYQTGDGRIHVVSQPGVDDAGSKGKTVTLSMVRAGTQLATSSPAVPLPQPRVNISNPAIRTVISTNPNFSSDLTQPPVRPPPESTYARKKPPIVKQPIVATKVITLNRTAADLKENPLQLQTGCGIIEVRANNVTKSATGQDQIVLGYGLPIIQLMPSPAPSVVEPPPLQQPRVIPTQSPPTPLPTPTAVHVAPPVTPVVTTLVQPQPTPSGLLASPAINSTAAAAVMGSGDKIVYHDGNRSFILNTVGYSQAQVNELIQQLQQRKIIIKTPEAPTQVTAASPKVQQLVLPQAQQPQGQQQIVLQQTQVVVPSQTAGGTVMTPQQRGMIQQIATIGGQKVFINRATNNPVTRNITPASGHTTQVFQKLLPGAIAISGGVATPKSIVSITPPGNQTQYRPFQSRQTVRPGTPSITIPQNQVSRSPLPISIVSPSKPRFVQTSAPIKFGMTSSPEQSTTISLSPSSSSSHPGIMTSQQLTGLLQQMQQSPVVSSTAVRLKSPSTQSPQGQVNFISTVTTPQRQLPQYVRPQVIPLPQQPNTASALSPPRLPAILRGSGPSTQATSSGSPTGNKVVAQIINTAQGPRLMIQGLPSKMSPTLLAQLESQLVKQMPLSGLTSGTPGSLTARIEFPPESGIELEHDSTAANINEFDHTVATSMGLIKKNQRTPQRQKTTSISLSQGSLMVEGTPKAKAIDESIEAAIGAVMQSGSSVIRHENLDSSPLQDRAITMGKRGGNLTKRASSPKKRKTSEMSVMDESSTFLSPDTSVESPVHDHDFSNAVETEARFVLTQDLVTQTESMTVPVNSSGNDESLTTTIVPMTSPVPMMSPVNLPMTDTSPDLQSQQSSITTTHKISRRKSPVRSDLTQSAKANAASQHKLITNLYKHKESLKRDLLKRRILLEKDLLQEIQEEISDELVKQGEPSHTEEVRETEPPVKPTKKRKSSERTSTLKTAKGRPSLPSGGTTKKKSKAKKKQGVEEEELYCICKTPYERQKFYVGCDKCDKWYHGDCIGITEEMSLCFSDYICDACQNPPCVELFCVCRQPYDDKQFYIACDKCDDWLHGRCVGVLPLEGTKMEQYICPNCDPSTPLNHTNLKPLTHIDYPHLEKLLKQLQTHKSSGAFREPVDVNEAPNYYRVIKEPMDLQTVEVRVEEKRYTRLRDFISDIMKIFDNCRSFNRPESQFFKSANTLETFFAQKIKLLRQTLA